MFDRVGVEHDRLEFPKHTAFIFTAGYGSRVGAVAPRLHVGTAPSIHAQDDPVGIANATFSKTGEKPLGVTLPVGGHTVEGRIFALDRVPRFIVDDTQRFVRRGEEEADDTERCGDIVQIGSDSESRHGGAGRFVDALAQDLGEIGECLQ